MSSRRRLAWAIAAAAAVLFTGRILALLYADHAWYDALGASPLWREKANDLIVIHVVSAVFAFLFALVNVYAIRRSIVSLAFPRRLGNVEFGEEVPERALDLAAFVLSAAVALVMSFAVPSWQMLAALRTAPRFGESDPFFQMDLSFYTGWIPLETAVYVWVLTLLVIVSALVIGLYALTPSLRWQGGAFHVSVRVRRHLSVLACLFLLTMAWSYRLDGYALLVNGSGPESMFSYVDHQWLLPAYLSLAIGTVAAAGGANFDGSIWTVSGSGADIWGTADAFQFSYLGMSGDGTLVARVTALDPTDVWAKAGVMIRETLDADAKFAMTVVTPVNGALLQFREHTGGSADLLPGQMLGVPLWVKLSRSGNVFSAALSTDGVNWTSAGSKTNAMATDVLAGLCLTSHTNAATARPSSACIPTAPCRTRSRVVSLTISLPTSPRKGRCTDEHR